MFYIDDEAKVREVFYNDFKRLVEVDALKCNDCNWFMHSTNETDMILDTYNCAACAYIAFIKAVKREIELNNICIVKLCDYDGEISIIIVAAD